VSWFNKIGLAVITQFVVKGVKKYNKQLKADGLVFCDIHLRSCFLICAMIGFKILN